MLSWLSLGDREQSKVTEEVTFKQKTALNLSCRLSVASSERSCNVSVFSLRSCPEEAPVPPSRCPASRTCK